jgi:hypothetical protein
MVPEELFFQSILAGTDFPERHELVDDALRFYRWDGVHAQTLTAEDLPALLESDALFARKVDMSVDSEVIGRLRDRISA